MLANSLSGLCFYITAVKPMQLPSFIQSMYYQYPFYVTLEINECLLKVLLLGTKNKTHTVLHSAVISLPQGAIKGTEIHDFQCVSKRFKTELAKMPFTPRYCAINTWGASIILKILTLQGDLTEEQLKSEIHDEIITNIPYAREDIVFDYVRLKSQSNTTQLTRSLLAVTYKPQIDEWSFLMNQLGFKPVVIEPEGSALISYLHTFSTWQLGTRVACFHLLRERAVFTALNTDGSPFIKVINRQLAQTLSSQHYDLVRSNTSDKRQPKNNKRLLSDISLLTQELGSLLTEFVTSIDDRKAVEVHLSGYRDLMLPLVERFLADGYRIKLSQCVNKMLENSGAATVDSQVSASFAVALGIACRRDDSCHI